MSRSFIELPLLPVFLLPLFPGLLQVVLAELHKSIKLAIRLQHSNAFDNTMLALHAPRRARSPLLGYRASCSSSGEWVCHLEIVIDNALLINLRRLLLKILHGHVLFAIERVVALDLSLDSVRDLLRGLESLDSFLQGCIKNRIHTFLLF